MIILKIQQFLDNMKATIMNIPDIHLRTYKLILTSFSNSLSEKERTRWNQEIIILLNIDTTQLSMKTAYKLTKVRKNND